MVSVKLIILGHLPIKVNISKLKEYKSNLFFFNNDIDYNTINNKSDISNWQYSDNALKDNLPPNNTDELVIAITNVPLERNYYTRILDNNIMCISYYEVADFLVNSNIKLENFIFRMTYNSVLLKMAFNRTPTLKEALEVIHDDTRGCIFDMTGIKSEIVYSTIKPTICEACSALLKSKKVSTNKIEILKQSSVLYDI